MNKQEFVNALVAYSTPEQVVSNELATEVYSKHSKKLDITLKSINDANDTYAFIQALVDTPKDDEIVVNGIKAETAPTEVLQGRINSVTFQGAFVKDDNNRGVGEDGEMPTAATDWTRSHFRIGIRTVAGELVFVIAKYKLLNRECAALIGDAKTGNERVQAIIRNLAGKYVALEVNRFKAGITYEYASIDNSSAATTTTKKFLADANHLISLTLDDEEGAIAGLYHDWANVETKKQSHQAMAEHLTAVVGIAQTTFTGSDIVNLLAQLK